MEEIRKKWDKLTTSEKEDIIKRLKEYELLGENEKFNPQFPEPTKEEECYLKLIMAFAAYVHHPEWKLFKYLAYERYKILLNTVKN